MFSFGFAEAQQALGLHEGLLGNSGSAFTDSSAPSYYNPSLLNKKKKDSYSLSANSFGSYTSKSADTKASSLALTPNYLGSIIVGDSLVHEIFFTSVLPSKITYVTNTETPTDRSRAELQVDTTQINFGYSMAFKSIPFALSYFADFYQHKSFGFNEFTSLNTPIRSTLNSKIEQSSLGVGISASSHISFNNYTLGFNLRTRRLNLFNKVDGKATLYAYGTPGPTDYTKTDVPMPTDHSASLSGHTLLIGHSFKIGDHEFLTDSNLTEHPDLRNRYQLIQTFGYRMNSSSGHQFLCGMNHVVGSDVKYVGQSAYYSTGYSWLTRSMRSAIGAYYYTSRLDQDVSALGLIFGSEFNY